MFYSELVAEANESIRVHHASGHFTTAEATARLTANGLTPEQAAALLSEPVGDDLFAKYRTPTRAEERP